MSEAVLTYRKAIEIDGSNFEDHNNLGSDLLQLKRYKEAEESLLTSIEIKPTDRAHANLGAVFFEQNMFEEAEKHFRTATELGNQPEHQYLLGVTLDQLGRYDEALECLETARLDEGCKAKANIAYEKVIKAKRLGV